MPVRMSLPGSMRYELAATALNPAAEIPVHENEWAPIGTPFADRGRVYAHPLDVIAVRFHRDPIGRLDAARDWIVKRAHERLDMVANRLDLEQAAENLGTATATLRERVAARRRHLEQLIEETR
ncbi:hypothetical protein [Agromyces sp. SYSU T00194]|uniref:hypothetical protein n=1 Tax=Agromyces chitinivorans TaxID=3158560 RepID=UPI003392374F